MFVQGKRYAVFSIRKPEDKNGVPLTDRAAIWVRAGSASVNKDGSLNVYLDVLPIDGKLHVREAVEKREPARENRLTLEPQPVQAAVS